MYSKTQYFRQHILNNFSSSADYDTHLQCSSSGGTQQQRTLARFFK